MTKYILHGGYTREPNEDNASFFAEMTKGFTGKIRILLVYFAIEDELVSEKFEEEKEAFLKSSGNKNLEFEVADVSKLKEQLEKADVMYIRGGSTTRLLNNLSKTLDLEKLFEDKTIAGSSAGAYALSKYFWNNDKKELQDGLGILNIKCFCHYKNENKEDLKKLLEYKEDLPIITLPDYKWVTIYK